MKLEKKVALVAGGGQGIGEAIVHCLAEEGADVAVVDINPDTARKTADLVLSKGRKGLAVTADLTGEKAVYKAVDDVLVAFGRIDILVSNVGGTGKETEKLQFEYAASRKDLAELPRYMRFSPEIWDQYYQLNLKSHVMLAQAVTPHFIKQQSGKIVNISSVAGRQAEPGLMPYAAMKAGDISFTWSLAKALALHNINVNCVCPGFVYTPLWEKGAAAYLMMARQSVSEAKKKGIPLPPELARFAEIDNDKLTPKEYWLKNIVIPSTPTGREQTAEDMGRAVVFLVSEDAKNITGQILHVDGGMTMR